MLPKSQNFIEFLTSAQSSSRNENFVSTSKKLLKNRNLTSPGVRYFFMRTRVFLKYLANDCIRKQFLDSNLPGNSSILILNHPN